MVYSTAVINARLQGIVTELGATANMVLKASGSTISTIQLSSPVGTVSDGVLTFTGTLLDPSASSTGEVDSAIILDSDGNTAISDLTVGIPGQNSNVIISNGLNSTLITAGQTVQLLSAEIQGS